jgi:hypothetical protein
MTLRPVARYIPAGVDVPKTANASACPRAQQAAGGRCGGIHWFRAADDSMAQLEHTGFLLASRSIGMMECPDVFELDGKVVVVVGAGGYTQFWVGSISDDDLTFLPVRRVVDYL